MPDSFWVLWLLMMPGAFVCIGVASLLHGARLHQGQFIFNGLVTLLIYVPLWAYMSWHFHPVPVPLEVAWIGPTLTLGALGALGFEIWKWRSSVKRDEHA